MESWYFYFRICDYESAKAAFNKSVDEVKALLDADNDDPIGNPIWKARLIASFYGLAQTYYAMNDIEKAVHILDTSSEYLLEMDKITGIHGSEIHSLIADLYERCDKSKRTCSLAAKTATI